MQCLAEMHNQEKAPHFLNSQAFFNLMIFREILPTTLHNLPNWKDDVDRHFKSATWCPQLVNQLFTKVFGNDFHDLIKNLVECLQSTKCK